MPIIGPIKFRGDDIIVRLVMIEMDQIENETQKQFIRSVVNTASTFVPEIGSVLSIAMPIAEFIINQNADDVIFDHRFSLQRVSKGTHAYRNALLFGKYIILIQEDRLLGTDVTEIAPQAVLPPAPASRREMLNAQNQNQIYLLFVVLYLKAMVQSIMIAIFHLKTMKFVRILTLAIWNIKNAYSKNG